MNVDVHRQECLCYKECPQECGHSSLERPLHEAIRLSHLRRLQPAKRRLSACPTKIVTARKDRSLTRAALSK
jgi:hypothetical protein